MILNFLLACARYELSVLEYCPFLDYFLNERVDTLLCTLIGECGLTPLICDTIIMEFSKAFVSFPIH